MTRREPARMPQPSTTVFTLGISSLATASGMLSDRERPFSGCDIEQSQVVPIVSLAQSRFFFSQVPILVESQSSDRRRRRRIRLPIRRGSVGTTGDTLEEAIRNMKDRLVSKFNVLDRMPSEETGATGHERQTGGPAVRDPGNDALAGNAVMSVAAQMVRSAADPPALRDDQSASLSPGMCGSRRCCA